MEKDYFVVSSIPENHYYTQNAIDDYKKQCEEKMQLFFNQMKTEKESKTNIDTMLEILNKVKKMYGNLTIGQIINNLEALKNGYLL